MSTAGEHDQLDALGYFTAAAEVMTLRGKQYDAGQQRERSMAKTIAAFNALTGRDLTEAEGWLLMSLLKRARQYAVRGRFHFDSALDAVSYAALEAEALHRGES